MAHHSLLMRPVRLYRSRRPRPAILAFKDGFHAEGRRAVGVEVGVFRGLNALVNLQVMDFERYVCVDSYPRYLDDGGWVDYRWAECNAHRILRRHGCVVWMRKSSLEAAGLLPAGLDFVYLDDDHGLEAVRAEICAWWPLVASGGMLAGHDFSTVFPGVVQAVTEAFPWSRLHVAGQDWWVWK